MNLDTSAQETLASMFCRFQRERLANRLDASLYWLLVSSRLIDRQPDPLIRDGLRQTWASWRESFGVSE